MIDKIIDYNKTFVEQKGYEKYLTYLPKGLRFLSASALLVWSRHAVELDGLSHD